MTFDKLTLHKEFNYKEKLKIKKLKHNFLKKRNFRKFNFIQKYSEKNLKKIFIIVSHVFCFPSILLIKKLNDKLRFCVKNRKFDSIIKKNKYSISLIIETFAQLSKIKIFFKIDIFQNFHRLKMRKYSKTWSFLSRNSTLTNNAFYHSIWSKKFLFNNITSMTCFEIF